MQSTTTYSRGDIVLVPYLFSDSGSFKNRPALVLSSDQYQASRSDMVVAALTTRIRDPLLLGDYLIENWQQCGLQKPSVATGILRTVKSFMVVRTMGTLPSQEVERYDEILRKSLGL